MKRSKTAALITAYIKIVIGSALYAAGFQFFLYENEIVAGGVTGISMIINYLTGLPVGVMTIVINIPLFAFAWKKFGIRFIIASLAGMLVSSVLLDLCALVTLNITTDAFLASVYGGIITGLGLGLVYSGGGTTGGIDIAAKFLRRRHPHINFGTLILILDAIIIAVFAVLFKKYDSAMFAVVSIFITSKVIDLVLYGVSNSKLCYIITDDSEGINAAISERTGRGVTLLHGQGGYTREDKEIILCVIKPQQIVELRRIVHEIDENAFVIVSDSREVFGNGFMQINDFD